MCFPGILNALLVLICYTLRQPTKYLWERKMSVRPKARELPEPTSELSGCLVVCIWRTAAASGFRAESSRSAGDCPMALAALEIL